MAAQDTIKALRARCTDLEAEVVRLKKELAARGKAEIPMREVTSRGIGKREGHGEFCQCFGCRA
jgi:hypothetical protein